MFRLSLCPKSKTQNGSDIAKGWQTDRKRMVNAGWQKDVKRIAERQIN